MRPPIRTSRRPFSTPTAFTLVEMVLSLAIVAVLVGAMTSVMTLSLRAIDDRINPAGKTVRAAEAADLILADLAVAIAFTERTETSVSFTVPDRTGDGLPETIRYAWSGVAGDPVVREFNAHKDAEFLPDVRLFSLAYIVQSEP